MSDRVPAIGDVVLHRQHGEAHRYVVCGVARGGGVLVYREDGRPMWTLDGVEVMYDSFPDSSRLSVVEEARDEAPE